MSDHCHGGPVRSAPERNAVYNLCCVILQNSLLRSRQSKSGTKRSFGFARDCQKPTLNCAANADQSSALASSLRKERLRSFPEQNGPAHHDSDHSCTESRDINGGSRRMKAGSTSWSQDTMPAIGDHRRWLRHGAMRIGSTWSEDGSRSRALQGDGNLQMGVGRYGKNSRATHVSRDKATRAVVYARGGPVA